MKKTRIGFGLVLGLLSGCAHSSYVPEVKGPGAVHVKQGVIYSVPPTSPVLKLRVMSSGLDDQRKLHVSLYVLKKGDSTGAYLVPSEQLVSLESQKNIQPSSVRAAGKKRNQIELTGEKQFIELAYSLPKTQNQEDQIQKFELTWKIHYASGKVESQTSRFNRDDPDPHPLSEGPLDPDYDLFNPGWGPTDTVWWY